jgi:hypothetical protein
MVISAQHPFPPRVNVASVDPSIESPGAFSPASESTLPELQLQSRRAPRHG